MDLVVIEGVPILRTGAYMLESGPVQFTAEHLTAAVAAFENDPAVLAPRIRVELDDQGHLEPENIAAEAGGGNGGPALGWADSLRVDGNTLYADLHVPTELAAVIEWAYPSRSIEGLFGYTTATGQTHDFLATGLLLLGTSWPGVTTLPDLRELQDEFAAEVAAAGVQTFATASVGESPASEAVVLARQPQQGALPARWRQEFAAAGLNVSDLRLRWNGAARGGDLDGLPESFDPWSWWLTEVRADDDGTLYVVVVDEESGDLWRFDVESIGATEVVFSAPRSGSMDWREAASAASPSRPALIRFPVRATAPDPNREGDDRPMNDAERRNLAQRLGLDPETATEAEIHAAAAETPPDPPNPNPETPPEGEPTPEGQPAPEGQPQPEAAAARTVNVSREVWEQTQRDAADGRVARASQVDSERTSMVTVAIRDGRITPAEAGLSRQADGTWSDGWRRDLDESPEVTARALERLERGKYPGGEPERGNARASATATGSLNRARMASGLPIPTESRG